MENCSKVTVVENIRGLVMVSPCIREPSVHNAAPVSAHCPVNSAGIWQKLLDICGYVSGPTIHLITFKHIYGSVCLVLAKGSTE